jgi:catechol 2,3-dioxygenase-like lactoylglutathione lyase family enzyme
MRRQGDAGGAGRDDVLRGEHSARDYEYGDDADDLLLVEVAREGFRRLSLAHLTLPTREVEATARFLQEMLGYARDAAPANSPVETVWLGTGGGQQLHIVYVEGFAVSAFEGEFGRHIAVTVAAGEMRAARDRLAEAGAEVMEPLRPSAHERFFFREPVNGYVFEVIARVR